MPAQPHPAAAPSVVFEIKWVWGRGGSEFHAIVPAPDGSKAILARSPRFRQRLAVSPDATRDVVAAHETLVGQLPAPAPPLICEIKWVWGRGRSEFRAIVPAPHGSKAILARSPRFRRRLPVSPDATRGAVAAHETLVRQLVAAGWQPCGEGSLLNWYATRFRAPETFAARPGTGSDA